MKILSLLPLLAVVSCSHISPKQDEHLSKLEALLSPEDLKIHRCLGGQLKSECLKGTPYEETTSRVPSSDDNDVVLKNNWFFNSSANLERFYELSRGFVKARQKLMSINGQRLMHGRGVSVEGSVYFGIGRSWAAEFMVLQDRIGLYCSPGYSLQTDIGLDVEFAVSRALSCPTHASYRGKDISFTAGISGELVGLPVGLGAAYNLGVDLDVFRARIEEARKKGQLNVPGLRNELARLGEAGVRAALTSGQQNALPLLALALRPLGLYKLQVPSLASNQAKLNYVKAIMRNNQSLGQHLRNAYTRHLGPALRSQNLNQLNTFFGILSQTLTICDSVGGSISVGLSISPVTLGVAYTGSVPLAEVGIGEVVSFAAVTPLLLLNPMLLQPQHLRNIVKVARAITSLPNKIEKGCIR